MLIYILKQNKIWARNCVEIFSFADHTVIKEAKYIRRHFHFQKEAQMLHSETLFNFNHSVCYYYKNPYICLHYSFILSCFLVASCRSSSVRRLFLGDFLGEITALFNSFAKIAILGSFRNLNYTRKIKSFLSRWNNIA